MTVEPPPATVPLGNAATVVVLRDGDDEVEALLVRRGPTGSFAGLWVFPGGRVEAGDAGDPTATHEPATDEPATDEPATDEPATDEPGAGGAERPDLAVARRAAVREAREEAALELRAADLTVLSHWIPPEGIERRYATWFFVCAAPPGARPVVDGVEIVEHRWLAPSDALRRHREGSMELLPPTFVTLSWLARWRRVGDLLGAARSGAPPRFASKIVAGPGTTRAIVWDGDAGYADGDLGRAGRRRRLTMDRSGWRLEIDE